MPAAAPRPAGGGPLDGLWTRIKGMFVDSTTGDVNLTSVISTVAIGGLGAYLGSGAGTFGAILGGVAGAAGGAFASPLISQLIGSISESLGISRPTVPGGIPRVPAMPVGVAADPLDRLPAPVVSPTPGVDPSANTISSPALERIPLPTASVSAAVTARRNATTAATRAANGTGNPDEAAAQFRDVVRQERSIADFVATMDEYGRRREAYMRPDGERANLVNDVMTRGNRTREQAEAMVPTLPPLPEGYTSNRTAPERVQNFRALYEQDRERGTLASEYNNKPWAELDPIMQAGYAYNKANQRVSATKGSININLLPPINRTSMPLAWSRGEHGAVMDLPKPDFTCTDHWSWRSIGRANNNASVCIARLRDDPDAQINGEYVTTTLRRYANDARSHIQNDRRAETDCAEEYGKIIQYCDAVEERRALLQDVNNMQAPVQALEDFRRTQLETSRTQVNQFLTAQLPMLNSEITARRAAATSGPAPSGPAPAPVVTPPPVTPPGVSAPAMGGPGVS